VIEWVCVCVCVGGSALFLCLRCLFFYTYPDFVCLFVFHWRPLEKHFLCHCIQDTLSMKSFSPKQQIWINTFKNAIQDTCTDRACKDAQTVRENFVEGQNENYTLPIYMKKTEHHNQLLPLVLLWLSVLLI